MTNRIEQALASLKPLFKPQPISAEEGNAQLQLAQAYASIAIAEQLRIANLIAMCDLAGGADEASKKLFVQEKIALAYIPQCMQPDIAEALGIGGESDG